MTSVWIVKQKFTERRGYRDPPVSAVGKVVYYSISFGFWTVFIFNTNAVCERKSMEKKIQINVYIPHTCMAWWNFKRSAENARSSEKKSWNDAPVTNEPRVDTWIVNITSPWRVIIITSRDITYRYGGFVALFHSVNLSVRTVRISGTTVSLRGLRQEWNDRNHHASDRQISVTKRHRVPLINRVWVICIRFPFTIFSHIFTLLTLNRFQLFSHDSKFNVVNNRKFPPYINNMFALKCSTDDVGPMRSVT